MTSNQLSVKPEKVKLPGPLAAKGRVTLTLTDADTGEVVEKVEQDNFISSGTKWLYEIQSKLLYQRDRHSDGMSESILNDPFRQLRLTDANHEEDPEKEWIIQGKTIGTANTNVGTTAGGSLAGQYNAVESFVDDDQVRIVVDFPAEAANGDINSVYFHPTEHLFKDGSYRGLKSVDGKSFTKYNNRIFAIDRYVSGVGTRYSRLYEYDLDYDLITHRILSSDGHTASRRHRQVSDMTIYNDRMYFIGYKQSEWVIFSIAISDIDMIPESDTDNSADWVFGKTDLIRDELFTGYLGNQVTSRAGLEYMPDKQQFLFQINTSTLALYDKDFNILETYKMTGASDPDYLVYHEGVVYIGSMTFDLDTGVLSTKGQPITVSGFTEDGYVIGSTKSSSYAHSIQPKFGFASRARLSTTVTKTTRYNMKVVYDFMLPSIYTSSI